MLIIQAAQWCAQPLAISQALISISPGVRGVAGQDVMGVVVAHDSATGGEVWQSQGDRADPEANPGVEVVTIGGQAALLEVQREGIAQHRAVGVVPHLLKTSRWPAVLSGMSCGLFRPLEVLTPECKRSRLG